MVRTKAILSPACAALAAFALSGCITIQAIEPVIEPPHVFMGDVTVPVEFAAPGTIGFRCAERGATFLGLPGINAGACADRSLVTMIDPCLTVTAGDYAGVMCRGLNRQRDEVHAARSDLTPATPPYLVRASLGAAQPPLLRGRLDTHAASPVSSMPVAVIEFVAASRLEHACAERGAKMERAEGGLEACADRLMVTMVNPCDPTVSGWYARTLCHELAHVNGWPADHPVGAHVRGPFRLASESPQAIALAAAREARTDVRLASAEPDPAQPAPDQAAMAENLAGVVRAFGLDKLPGALRTAWTSLRSYAAMFSPSDTDAIESEAPVAIHAHAGYRAADSGARAR